MPEKAIEASSTCHCHDVVRERNRYFTGKFMTARDFQVEQDYTVSHLRWHNRLFHGWGVVCGLEVVEHPDAGSKVPTDCAWRWVVVKAGVAVDCCGRSLVLERDTAFALPIRPQKGEEGEAQEVYWERPFLICLHYHEEKIEIVPALYADGECDPHRKEANRLRETVRLSICDPEELSDCWRGSDSNPEAHCHDDCGESSPGPVGVCLEAYCPCGHMVPLAYVKPNGHKDKGVKGYHLTLKGRPNMPPSGNYLTHIVHFNWPHGGLVPISTLRDKWQGQLRVLFDRKLKPANGLKNGINEFTFVVQHGDLDENLEFLTPGEESPSVEDDRWAVFSIDDRLLYSRRGDLTGRTIYVTLKCDFILDCHNNAVDGNHLGGETPTGNGTPGGIFESWFRVVPDGYKEDDEKWQKGA
jgi:hypothetical protein